MVPGGEHQKALGDERALVTHKYVANYGTEMAREAAADKKRKASDEEILRVRLYFHGVVGIIREWAYDDESSIGKVRKVLREEVPEILREKIFESEDASAGKK